MKIFIKNFQSHKKTILNLASPGVNVIWGISMHGKSSVIRALRKLFLNRPVGFPFKSDWGGVSEISALGVKLKVDKEPEYISENITSRKFASTLPAHIKSKANISDINFQFQHDKPFFFGSPTQTAREINAITNQEEINALLQSANFEISDVEKKIENVVKENKYNRKTLKKYKSIPKIGRMIRDLKAEVKRKEEIEEKIEKIQEAVETCKAIKKKIKIIKEQKKLVEKALPALEIAIQTEVQIYQKIKALNEYLDIQKTVKDLRKEKREARRKYLKMLGNKCPLCLSDLYHNHLENLT